MALVGSTLVENSGGGQCETFCEQDHHSCPHEFLSNLIFLVTGCLDEGPVAPGVVTLA